MGNMAEIIIISTKREKCKNLQNVRY